MIAGGEGVDTWLGIITFIPSTNIGLFSVPAPPFRSQEQDGGVFSYLSARRSEGMADNAWSINGDIASAKVGSSELTFDASNPSAGLTFAFDGNVVCAKLFALLLNDEPVEMFVRISDLVVRLPHRNSDLVAYELCFRTSEDGREIDLLLSAETNLLDSKPETKVSTSLLAGTVNTKSDASDLTEVTNTANFESESVADYFVHRPTAMPDHSILLLSHPTDFHRAAAESGDAASVSIWVFPESLEKGVIRRARFKLCVLDRANDETKASEIVDGFRSEAPPLAT